MGKFNATSGQKGAHTNPGTTKKDGKLSGRGRSILSRAGRLVKQTVASNCGVSPRFAADTQGIVSAPKAANCAATDESGGFERPFLAYGRQKLVAAPVLC
jgi:hypothetical protein